MLNVYVDFKSPASYLAIGPTLELIARTGTTAYWHPYSTLEGDLPTQAADETVGQSHRRVRAEQRRATLIKYAALQAIDLRFPVPRGTTDLALGILASIKTEPLAFIHAAFAAYWTDHANLDDEDTVLALLSASGYDASHFDMDAARRAYTMAQDAAETLGIVEAPAYIIGDQLFIGREHLPWIEEIISS